MSTLAIEVADWNAARRAELDAVPDDLTVAELIGEVRDAMSLPRDTPYELIYGGEKLARGSTLGEVGIRSGEELTIAPEVSAGGHPAR